MSFLGKVAIVVGGAGNVGEGMVRAYLAAGANVAVPSRDAARLDSLLAALPPEESQRVLPIAGDVSQPDDAERIREVVLSRFDRVDSVVAALGGWWQGASLLETRLEVWDRLLASLLTSHFVAAKHLLPPMLAAGGSYTLINGFAGVEPHPGAGAVSVAAAAQLMFGRCLAAELASTPVRVNELVLGPIISRSRPTGRPEWLTSRDVGDFVVRLSSTSGVRGQVIQLLDRPRLEAVSRELFR